MPVNSFQQRIYNCYLSSLAKANNRPYRARRDFSTLTEEKVNTLEKLEGFFTAHKHINIGIFMDAPHKVYSDNRNYNLEDYCKPMALKTYFLYLNLLDSQSPDSDENLGIILDSIIFIKNFCLEHRISLMNYLNHSETVTSSWCNHLLNQEISIYNLLAFSHFGINIYMLINRLPLDEKELFLHQYNDNITEYMKKFNDSKKAKRLLIDGYKKIEKIINENLISQ